MIKTTKQMDADFDTKIEKINSYAPTIGNSTILIKWSDATGTLDGTVDILAHLDLADDDAWGVIGTLAIDTASGRELLYSTLNCRGISASYTANGITAGEITIILKGVD